MGADLSSPKLSLLQTTFNTLGEYLMLGYGHDVVVPETQSQSGSGYAVYFKRYMAATLWCLQKGMAKAIRFLSEVRMRYCADDDPIGFDSLQISFTNINSKRGLEELEQRLLPDVLRFRSQRHMVENPRAETLNHGERRSTDTYCQ